MPCYSPLKGWRDPETGGIAFKPPSGPPEKMDVACGQCLGCRLDRSRTWAMRIVHEASLYDDNAFVTLTYRDARECDPIQRAKGWYVPDDWSLHRKHFVDFMKRLRKAFPDRKIRYFMCGEYGNRCKHSIDLERVGCPLCNTGRPHFHACIFNIAFPDLDVYGSQRGEDRYTSKLLERIWRYGFVDVGELNFDSAAYVARYVLKKVTGVNADDHYTSIDLDGVVTHVEPEYCTMSRGRRPDGGIGYRWFQKYGDDVFPSDETPVPGVGVVKSVPRYYEEIFKESNPLSLEDIKEVRQTFMREHGYDYTPARLMDKYRVKKAQTEMLKRTGQ